MFWRPCRTSGRSLVRQVVAARELRPLVSLDDAGSRVRGLGPVTLAQIAPYLRFEASAQPELAEFEVAIVDRRAAKPRSTGRKTTTIAEAEIGASSAATCFAVVGARVASAGDVLSQPACAGCLPAVRPV